MGSESVRRYAVQGHGFLSDGRYRRALTSREASARRPARGRPNPGPEALADRAALDVVVPDQGSYRADLQAFLIASFALSRLPHVPDILRALMARAQIDEEFGQRFRASFLQHRRDALAVLVDRAQARGDLPRKLTPDTVADVVFGVIWYRLLAGREPFGDRLAGEIASTLSAPDGNVPAA